MNDAGRFSVSILDKEYQVACSPEERHDLMRAASELDSRMRTVRKSGSIVGLERIAIMVALNLCHELQRADGVDNTEATTALERIHSKLEEALSAE
jgi:cell division protein ZapA